MRYEEKKLRIRVFLKTFLYSKGGRYTAKELAAKMNETDVGLGDGVTSGEIARILRNEMHTNKSQRGFLRNLRVEERNGKGNLYYLFRG